MAVTNPRLLPFPIASTTGELANADQIILDGSGLTALLQGAVDVQAALERIDATGLGAAIFRFTGSYSAQDSNIAEWFNNKAATRLRGIGSGAGDGSGVFNFELPPTSSMTTVFDQLVTEGLPEVFQMTVEYTGGPVGANFLTNRLNIQARSSPNPQIQSRTSVTLRSGQSATFEITRNGGVISSYLLIALGIVETASGTSQDDIELQNPASVIWDASTNGPLPTVVLKGYAFLVRNAPSDGSGRFGEVMQNGDWVVWQGETFTTWAAEPHQWFVLAGHDVRRISQLESDFLSGTLRSAVSDRNSVIRGVDYAIEAAEIRLKIYASSGAYTPADLNTTGIIDAYTDASDQTGILAIRLPGQQVTLAPTLPNLYVYSEDSGGNFTLLFNMERDFTFRGDFGAESDYTSDRPIDYTAGDTIRIYRGETVDRFSNPNLDILIGNLSDALQALVNAPGHNVPLPQPLSVFAQEAEVTFITHSEFRSNNAHVFLSNAGAVLKNQPTSFPIAAGGLNNEINGSADTIDDPNPLGSVIDPASATNNIMTGAALHNGFFGVNSVSETNWRLILGGWIYLDSLPTEYTPILKIAERQLGAYRDVFGIDSQGLAFKARATTGSTANFSVRHPLTSLTGLELVSITASSLQATFRVYNAETYLVQISGYNNNSLVGGEAFDYIITDVNADQSKTSQNYNLGAGTQAVDRSFTTQVIDGEPQHFMTIEVDSIIAGLDELRVDVLAASTVVPTSAGNTYNDLRISDGHIAANRLMRFAMSFRSIGGSETGNLECVLSFAGYDSNGQPRIFDENTFDLLYPALDLTWDDWQIHSSANDYLQNIQWCFLSADTPLFLFPLHSTLNADLQDRDNKASDYVFRRIHGPDQDTEEVKFVEPVNLTNLILTDTAVPDNDYRITVANGVITPVLIT